MLTTLNRACLIWFVVLPLLYARVIDLFAGKTGKK
jgi:hypothetical protein